MELETGADSKVCVQLPIGMAADCRQRELSFLYSGISWSILELGGKVDLKARLGDLWQRKWRKGVGKV
jgi:hypothetical protein